MDKYQSSAWGFQNEAEADAWGAETETLLLEKIGDQAMNYTCMIRTQPNSQTGLWSCSVTVERL